MTLIDNSALEGAERQVSHEPCFLQPVILVVIELHGSYELGRFQEDLAPWDFVARPPSRAHVLDRARTKGGIPR
jgi:hypothetical protein